MEHNRIDGRPTKASETALDVVEAAEYARVAIKTVRDAMRNGHLMWKRLGNDKYTARPWIEEWMNG